MIEVKVSFDSVGEMLDFFGGKAGSVQQVAQVLKDEVQKVMAEPAAPVAQPITPQQPITAAPQQQPQQPQPQPITPQQPITAAPQQQPQQPQPQLITPQQPQPQPTTPQQRTYTKDEIARACAPLANDRESMRMLQELLASYNAISLHDLDKSQYPDFAEKLRNLGVSV